MSQKRFPNQDDAIKFLTGSFGLTLDEALWVVFEEGYVKESNPSEMWLNLSRFVD